MAETQSSEKASIVLPNPDSGPANNPSTSSGANQDGVEASGDTRGDGGQPRRGRGRQRNYKFRDQPYRKSRGGRGHWNSGYSRRREEVQAETLQAASLAGKDDRLITFDCRLRPKTELTDWIRYHKPSVLKKSADKIGAIAILSSNCCDLAQEKLAMGSEDTLLQNADLIRDWESLTSDPTSKIDYSSMKALARKHQVLGGKWLFMLDPRHDDIDAVWMFICSSVASGESPMPCVAAKITPKDDTSPGRKERGHMVSVYTRDFTDEGNVFAVEAALRSVPIKLNLSYKPDLYSVLGIYRNNKYGLRPTIYYSQFHLMSGKSVIESVFDFNWSYVGGSGDVRTKKSLEQLVDKVIGKNLVEEGYFSRQTDVNANIEQKDDKEPQGANDEEKQVTPKGSAADESEQKEAEEPNKVEEESVAERVQEPKESVAEAQSKEKPDDEHEVLEVNLELVKEEPKDSEDELDEIQRKIDDLKVQVKQEKDDSDDTLTEDSQTDDMSNITDLQKQN